jgi:hypothetical protein
MRIKSSYGALVIAPLLLAGCQGNAPKISPADAARQYHDCTYTQYNKAVTQGTDAGDKAIRQAISDCGDLAMTYALSVSRENGHMPDKQYKNASETYRPLIEKQTAIQLKKLIATIRED